MTADDVRFLSASLVKVSKLPASELATDTLSCIEILYHRMDEHQRHTFVCELFRVIHGELK